MRRHGFTLIEVMVALAVFALSAIVLGSAYVNVLNAYENAGRATQRDEDLRFARAQLLAEPDKKKAEEGGDFALPGGQQVHWHATIDSALMPDLFQVTFSCELSSAETATRNLTETFFLLRPTWADAAENGKLRQAIRDRIAELNAKKR